MEKATSKPIFLIERPKGSWKLVPVRELFVILYEDTAWKKDETDKEIMIIIIIINNYNNKQQ